MLHGRALRKLETYLLDIPNFLLLDKTRHHDLHYFWRALASGAAAAAAAAAPSAAAAGAPSAAAASSADDAIPNLGAKYAAAVEKHKGVLLSELKTQFKECDPRTQPEASSTAAQLLPARCCPQLRLAQGGRRPRLHLQAVRPARPLLIRDGPLARRRAAADARARH